MLSATTASALYQTSTIRICQGDAVATSLRGCIEVLSQSLLRRGLSVIVVR